MRPRTISGLMLSIPVLLLLFSLLSLIPILSAIEVSAGPWALQTDLNESDARALLSQLSFQPDASVGNRWLISSSTLLLSDAGGDLQPNLSLSSACASPANCTSTSDVYARQNGSIARVGRLLPKSNSIFVPPRSNPTTAAEAPASTLNESTTPLASINPSFSIPSEYLWAVALILVMLVTVTFLVRNRD